MQQHFAAIVCVLKTIGSDYRLHGKAVACITGKTILVVTSAPGFPHGVIENVRGGSPLQRAEKGVLCHVDACLGGCLLPSVKQLGMTSLSVDTPYIWHGTQGHQCCTLTLPSRSTSSQV